MKKFSKIQKTLKYMLFFGIFSKNGLLKKTSIFSSKILNKNIKTDIFLLSSTSSIQPCRKRSKKKICLIFALGAPYIFNRLIFQSINNVNNLFILVNILWLIFVWYIGLRKLSVFLLVSLTGLINLFDISNIDWLDKTIFKLK